MKKIPVMLVAGAIVFMLSSCGQAKDAEEGQTDTAYDVLDSLKAENGVKSEQSVSVTEDITGEQAGENTEVQMTTEELLDAFIDGKISAVSSEDPTSTFYITDLKMDSEEWDSYSIGEKVDLDNDGEDELIICGPYGGIYLDARDNKVYEFARGDGTGLMLSYVVYNGAAWIMYSSRMHAEYEVYYMKKFEGADYLAAEINFGEEAVDPNNIESGRKYTWNGTEMSHEEYTALASKIFATEVYTN